MGQLKNKEKHIFELVKKIEQLKYIQTLFILKEKKKTLVTVSIICYQKAKFLSGPNSG